MSGAFVWIYSRGVDAARWAGQGMRLGVAVALLTVVPTYLIYYVVQPMPAMTVVKQIVFDGILVVLLGLVVGRWIASPSRACAKRRPDHCGMHIATIGAP